MEITGIIRKIYDTHQVSERFKKRDLVVTIDPTSQYPQHVTVQLTQDKVSLVETYREGDEVRVNINLQGREWTSPQGEVKYFNTISVWRVELLRQGEGIRTAKNETENTAPPVFTSNSADDDLPF